MSNYVFSKIIVIFDYREAVDEIQCAESYFLFPRQIQENLRISCLIWNTVFIYHECLYSVSDKEHIYLVVLELLIISIILN